MTLDFNDFQKQDVKFNIKELQKAQITDFRQQGCNVFAGGLGLTDGLGFDVALVLQVFGLLLQTLALFFESDKSSDVEVIALDSQRLSNLFWVAAQQLDI